MSSSWWRRHPRPDRDLVHLAIGHRRACRHGPGFSRGDADADDLRRRHGRRYSSAIARALGAGRRDDADALVLHALIINVALGAFFSVVMLAFGRPIYQALGGRGGELDAALLYSNIVFGGNVLLWTMNALASAIRGTGNMLVPALVTCAGVVLLVPLSPCLIFGIGPFPALGIAGGGTGRRAVLRGLRPRSWPGTSYPGAMSRDCISRGRAGLCFAPSWRSAFSVRSARS